MRVRRSDLEKNSERIEAILRDGVEKGQKVSGEVLDKVKTAMKINYGF